MSATMSPVKEEIFAKVDEEYLAKKLPVWREVIKP